MKNSIVAYQAKYGQITKRINKINEEIVQLLNEIETDFNFNPYKPDNEEVKELWECISKARNWNIYE